MHDHNDILSYWFGRVEKTIVPSPKRTELWFGMNNDIDNEIRQKFSSVYECAQNGRLDDWAGNPRSSLALIIILDQFSRHIYRDTPMMFDQDVRALTFCLEGIEQEMDHELSLIERVFYLFPLMHSEDLEIQATSVRGFQLLVELALPETRGVYEEFLDHAVEHYKVIKEFDRFPHRNEVLGRKSTPEETSFLREQFGQSLHD